MQIIKWLFPSILIILLGSFLHYTLPGKDLVRVVGSDVKRVDTSTFWDSEVPKNETRSTRDVRFINTVWPDGTPRVFRNEDTDWSWPPYLKFDSGNLQAEAQSLISTEAAPVWVVVTHYGWRIPILTLFPNAVDIRRATGPDELLIPWFNIFFFVSLGIVFFLIGRFLLRLKRRHLDPTLDEVAEAFDDFTEAAEAASQRTRETGSKFSRWLDTWRAKDKRKK
ncbi:DUF1523 family protein [Kiloniella laminariae]|uniref:DUF1523 family protein n=1 Tax=Kiloniella laminariae TaxID=454162 RepID=UPI000379F765|nr:DUF1523 family protein [Kiloniella laminariae]